MARLLYLAPLDRHLRGDTHRARDTGSEEGCQGASTARCRELFSSRQLVYAAEEGGQVFWRLAKSLPYDRAPDAARPGETVQRVR